MFRDLDLDGIDLTIAFMRQEELEIFKKISECQKTAAILPSYLSHSFRRLLQQKRAVVGRQVFYQPTTAFYLKGLIPMHILQRISGMHESGI